MTDLTAPSRPGASGRELEDSIRRATEAILARQQADGHWVFELEADCTIPGQYVLLQHYLGDEIAAPLAAKIGVYLRRIQGAHGGWPLFQDGDFDMSASVIGYFALKMIGRFTRCGAHAARARGDPRPRRRPRKVTSSRVFCSRFMAS